MVAYGKCKCGLSPGGRVGEVGVCGCVVLCVRACVHACVHVTV